MNADHWINILANIALLQGCRLSENASIAGIGFGYYEAAAGRSRRGREWMYRENDLDDTIRECTAAIVKALGYFYRDLGKKQYPAGGTLYFDELAKRLG